MAEVALVLVITTIVAAIATPRYFRSLARYRVDAAAKRIVADLQLARNHARSLSKNQTVTFNPANETYRLVEMPDLRRGRRQVAAAMSSNEYRVDLTLEPYNSIIVSANFGGDPSVVFDGYGQPDTGGTVVVSSADITKTVTLDGDTAVASIQ